MISKLINFSFLFILLFVGYSCQKEEGISPIKVDIYDLNGWLKPNITISATQEERNALPIGSDLEIYLESSIDTVIVFNDSVKVRKFRCDLIGIDLLDEDGMAIVEGLPYDYNLRKDTITVGVAELMKADSFYSLQLNLEYFEEIDNVWKKPELSSVGNSEFVIKKEFKSAKLTDDIIDMSSRELMTISNVVLSQGIYPLVTFSNTPNEEIKVSLDGKTIQEIRPIIKELRIKSATESIKIDQKWNSPTELLIFPQSVYSNATEYEFMIAVKYEVKNEDGWEIFSNLNGDAIEEVKTLSFVSGDYSGDKIPEALIETTYPLLRQFNFYPKEYLKGYIQLFVDPIALKQVDQASLLVKFIELPTGNELSSASAVCEGRTIWYDIPEGLMHEKPYRIQLISNGKLIYENEFRTSKYQRFLDKIPESLNMRFYYNTPLEGNNAYKVDFLGASIVLDEPDECLDYYEIVGNKDICVVKISPMFEQWDWYQNSVYNYIYNSYSVKSWAKISTESKKLGIPPSKFDIWQVGYNRKLTDEEIQSGSFEYEAELIHFMNKSYMCWAQDYLLVKNELRKIYLYDYDDIEGTMEEKILQNNYPIPGDGNYSIKLEYILPGKDIVTSTKVVHIENSIGVASGRGWD